MAQKTCGKNELYAIIISLYDMTKWLFQQVEKSAVTFWLMQMFIMATFT